MTIAAVACAVAVMIAAMAHALAVTIAAMVHAEAVKFAARGACRGIPAGRGVSARVTFRP